jgi:hypothetical protein
MFGIDRSIASLGTGATFVLVMGVAVLLGLRHATDPDHLTAVTTLVAGEGRPTSRGAARLGFAWGLGHATTLSVLGLPIVLAGDYLPESVQRGAEAVIGFVIMGLAARLLWRWRGGALRTATDAHGAVSLESARPARSPLQAYGIGCIHGIGGSAGVGVLLLASIPNHLEGIAALLLFAAFTAVSMAIASTGFGYTLSRGPVLARFMRVAPVLGVASLAFGAWYVLGAVSAVPYAF